MDRPWLAFGLVAALSLPAMSQADSGENIAAGSQNKSTFRWVSNFDELRVLPGFTLTSPSGLVPSEGVIFGSVAGVTDLPGDGGTDGAASVGAGFGNAQEGIGGAVTLGIGSIDPRDGSSFERGTLSVSIGSFNSDKLSGLSIGAQGIPLWDGGDDMPDPSYYAALTQLFPNDTAPLVLTMGIGTNGYRFLRSQTDDPDQKAGAFVALAAYVAPQLSVIGDYTSGIASLGVSLVPLPDLPVTIQLSAWDVATYVDDHDNPSFRGSVAYVYQY
ncbi:MAG: hypothetical protein R3208_13015 [Ketobacteraceae bacterium]|nr:hypothetical protein [Ketobacteraceae bacterium]